MNQPTLFPEPERKRKVPEPRVKEGEAFDVRPYMWVFGAVCGRASHFPTSKWIKSLKQVEDKAGKMAALRGWAMYLNSNEARYVSAQSFAKAAGQWTKEAPDCPDEVFQSKQSVWDFFSAEEVIQPPSWVVQRGYQAVQEWMKERS